MPAVLDAVPYRKGDGTAARDATRYPYIAGHGYACVRLDLRGSGDSEGWIPDEYTEQEQDDVEAVIAWLARQPWCDGAVGMIGVSWGGFAALQAAARNPPALRGIVAIHASDDRYADDVHYIGGCVLATDMVHWCACMAAYVGQPPDPAVVGEGWRDAWRERLEAMEPWVATWLAHQRRDDYWRQGSACERYDAIECPVFAVGGWVDGYRDMCLRVAEHVRAPVRALIGPWGHTWPERGAPGPAIGFLQEVVRFFDCALKGVANGFLDEPRVVSWMRGRWVAEPAWPSPNVATRELALDGERARRGLAADRPRGRRLVRRRLAGRRAGRPADRGRRVAVLGLRAAAGADRAARPRRRRALAERGQADRVRRRAAVRRRARRELVTDRARRPQPHAPRGARPGRAARAGRAGDACACRCSRPRTSSRAGHGCGWRSRPTTGRGSGRRRSR